MVNRKPVAEYFPTDRLQYMVQQPLNAVEVQGKFDILVNVAGGGVAGQAGATRHGVARALLQYNPEFRKKLKTAGFLTRDPREVERKKYGQRKARARFQFSKR